MMVLCTFTSLLLLIERCAPITQHTLIPAQEPPHCAHNQKNNTIHPTYHIAILLDWQHVKMCSP